MRDARPQDQYLGRSQDPHGETSRGCVLSAHRRGAGRQRGNDRRAEPNGRRLGCGAEEHPCDQDHDHEGDRLAGGEPGDRLP